MGEQGKRSLDDRAGERTFRSGGNRQAESVQSEVEIGGRG
jgi:hypothetical protein